jgi:hypothetical protein
MQDRQVLDRLKTDLQAQRQREEEARKQFAKDQAEERESGRAWGRTWAREKASVSQLRQLAAAAEPRSRVNAGPQRRPAELIPTEQGKSFSFKEGAAEAALEEWSKFKDQIES